VVGGFGNTASGYMSIVGGGCGNTASGDCSGVLGGVGNNTCGFANSFIVGSNINATQACTTFTNCIAASNLTAGCGVCVATNGVLVNYPSLAFSPNYGAFSMSTTLSATLANTEYLATYDTTALSSGVSVVSSTQITMANAGVYNIQFSAQLIATSSSADVDIWFKKNGTNIANTNTTVQLANNAESVAAWNIVESFTAGQYVEIAWSADSTGVQMLAAGTKTTPTRPATPSIIVTVTRVA
jgi:hypothetical protein